MLGEVARSNLPPETFAFRTRTRSLGGCSVRTLCSMCCVNRLNPPPLSGLYGLSVAAAQSGNSGHTRVSAESCFAAMTLRGVCGILRLIAIQH